MKNKKSRLVDIHGLRASGIFPEGKVPCVRTIREWTMKRVVPFKRVGGFVWFDPQEVLDHMMTNATVEPVPPLDAQ